MPLQKGKWRHFQGAVIHKKFPCYETIFVDLSIKFLRILSSSFLKELIFLNLIISNRLKLNYCFWFPFCLKNQRKFGRRFSFHAYWKFIIDQLLNDKVKTIRIEMNLSLKNEDVESSVSPLLNETKCHLVSFNLLTNQTKLHLVWSFKN